MSGVFELSFRIDPIEVSFWLVVIAVLASIGVWKKSFAFRARAWPMVEATIENVFVVSSTRGMKVRYEVTNAVLAYSYSLGGSYYSGEIKLLADDHKVPQLEAKLIGQKVHVHYNPSHPEASIFTDEQVHGWTVVEDQRTSLLSWLNKGR